jgi:Adenylosuccinate synthetase
MEEESSSNTGNPATRSKETKPDAREGQAGRGRVADVVGGQYGSEGKGNICSHPAHEYEVFVRVGGPNAGHMVADPPYKYVQIPSGTGSNDKAKILIGPGATIWVPQILKEIADHGLKKDRIVIDENAMIIEQSDRDFESQSKDSIGSTKQGVGAATARKIVGREQEHMGAAVRLAGLHPDLKEFIGSTARELEDAYASGKRIMLEGTQGTSYSEKFVAEILRLIAELRLPPDTRRSGGQRLPKTVNAQRAAPNPAGNRNHLCQFGVHLADSELMLFWLGEGLCDRRRLGLNRWNPGTHYLPCMRSARPCWRRLSRN